MLCSQFRNTALVAVWLLLFGLPVGLAGADAPTLVPATGTASPTAISTAISSTDVSGTDVSGATASPCSDTLTASAAESTAVVSIAYRLERIELRGSGMRSATVTAYVPLSPGDTLNPDDPALEQARFQLIGTGFFESVKLSLERGSRRGWVVLVIDVKERNTLVVERVIAGLSRVVQNSGDEHSPARPYLGLGVVERNLFGLGMGVGLSGLFSLNDRSGKVLQYALHLGLNGPSPLGGGFDFRGRLFHNRAREFFGRNTQVVNHCLPPSEDDEDGDPACDPDIEGQRAVVIYDRSGFGFGADNDLSPQIRYSIDWLGERVNVINKPQAADTQRGTSPEFREPIDFRIEDGVSLLSSLRLSLQYDTRNHPTRPTRGDRFQLTGRISGRLLGSDYDFTRTTLSYEHYTLLPWGHVLELGALAGAVLGRAPFFYRFYAADLSDLLPSRQLGLNLDHRRTHNLFGTSIREMDAEEIAGRIHGEYQLPLIRSGGLFRRVDGYLRVGLFMLARRQDLRVAIPGYRGAASIPLDFTFDVGVVADTEYGLFKFGFSSLIGFLPDLGRDGS